MKNLYLIFIILILILTACNQPVEKEPTTIAGISEATVEFKTPLPQATEAQVKPTSTPVPPPSTPTPRPTPTPSPTPEEVAETTTEKTATDTPLPLLPVTEVMIEIPAGPFMMGNDGGVPETSPAHQIDLPAYKIDQFEVTNADFSTFVKLTGYVTDAETAGKKNWHNEFTEGRENHPVIRVTWNDAAAYCQWLGKRLPTEAEWEKAARGVEGFIYPWGNEWDASKANVKEGGLRDTVAGGSFGAGASPYSVEDMGGNVWEWTADWYQAYPGNTTNDAYYGEQCRVTRGGGWFDEAPQVTTFNRNCADPDITSINELGFRCAR